MCRTDYLPFALVLLVLIPACGEPQRAEPRSDTVAAADSAQPTAPRIERRRDGAVLVLTEEMERALLAKYPGFRPWPPSDYLAEISQYEPPTERSAPFAAIGDFNGGGRLDVVVDGHDSTRGLLLTLFTEGDSVRVVLVRERPLPPPDQRSPRDTFLALVPRGVVRAHTIENDGYNPIAVTIEHDGFEVVYWQKAAEFFYWRNRRFVQWITSN